MIFSWIESDFGDNNAEWIAVCDREMHEFDENEDEDEDDNIINVEIEEDGQIRAQRRRQKGKQKASQINVDTAKRGFLRFLIRCRRIILQDAAVYIHLSRYNSLLSSNDRIFSCGLFKIFQQDIVAAINNPSLDILQEYENAMLEIVDASKDHANRIGMVHNTLIRGQQKQEEELRGSKEKLNDQNVFKNSFDSLMYQIIKDQQTLMLQQQCLNSKLDLLLASKAATDLALSSSSNTFASSSVPTPSTPSTSSFPLEPSFSSTSPFPLAHYFSTSNMPFLNMPFPHQNVAVPSIQPAPTLSNNPNPVSRSSTPPPKKKGRWVSYEPQTSN